MIIETGHGQLDTARMVGISMDAAGTSTMVRIISGLCITCGVPLAAIPATAIQCRTCAAVPAN